MRPAASAEPNRCSLPCRLRACAGFTLIESLIALAMFMFVLVGVFATADFSSKNATNEAEHNEALSEVTSGAARILSELRRAYQVNKPRGTTESGYMDVLVRLPVTGAVRVFINCEYKEPGGSYDECVRYQQSASESYTAGEAPKGVTPQVIVPRVLNETKAEGKDKVFRSLATPSGSGEQPTYGELVLHTPSKGRVSASYYTHQVEIKEAFYMRDLDYGH